MSPKRELAALAICGPTASGKSEIAVMVAERIGGEIVNADSRQIYRELTIGTGVPSPSTRQRVPHHLYQFVDPCERYSAGAYARDAAATIDAIRSRGASPIVVGGTGLYIEALAGSMPMDRTVAGDDVRARVRAEAGTHPHEFLHAWLRTIAPKHGARVMSGDKYRTLRALESALTERAKGEEEDPLPSTTHPRLRTILVEVDPMRLGKRIALRVQAMFDEGIADEAIAVWRRCPRAPALTGIGYAEALAWNRGELTRAEAIAQSIARTKRYMKRQQTWFRRMGGATRVDADDARSAAECIARIARETVLAT